MSLDSRSCKLEIFTGPEKIHETVGGQWPILTLQDKKKRSKDKTDKKYLDCKSDVVGYFVDDSGGGGDGSGDGGVGGGDHGGGVFGVDGGRDCVGGCADDGGAGDDYGGDDGGDVDSGGDDAGGDDYGSDGIGDGGGGVGDDDCDGVDDDGGGDKGGRGALNWATCKYLAVWVYAPLFLPNYFKSPLNLAKCIFF